MAIFGLEHRKRNMKNIPWTYGNVRWFGGRGPSTDSSDATWICFLIFLQINFPMVNHHLREYMLGLAYILRTKWVNKLFVLMKGSRFLAFIICWFIIVLGMAQLLCVYPRNQVGRMCKPPGILMLKKISFALFYPFFFKWQKSDASWLDAILLGQNFPGLEEMVLGEGREDLWKYGRQVVETLAVMENMFIQNVHPFHQKNSKWQFSLIQTPFF